jgi:hypothetical protein
METSFGVKCEILADLWMNYRDDEEFVDFIEYNDLGLPMAYIVASSLGEVNEVGKGFIQEAWDLFLGALGIEDEGFSGLNEILGS